MPGEDGDQNTETVPETSLHAEFVDPESPARADAGRTPRGAPPA